MQLLRGDDPPDGTSPDDGWALFSGTSAAAPQIAGPANVSSDTVAGSWISTAPFRSVGRRLSEVGPWAEPYPRPGFSTEAVQTPARVNVTCVTPLGEEVASTS
jgi:hypothetical protein